MGQLRESGLFSYIKSNDAITITPARQKEIVFHKWIDKGEWLCYTLTVLADIVQLGGRSVFQIHPYSPIPVYEQIIHQVERFVLSGIMQEGDALPSVRNLSIQLSVNPNTIQKAYSELDKRGISCAVPGKGCFIAAGARVRLTENYRSRLNDMADLIKELVMAGISKEEILACVEKAYEGGEQNDSNESDHEKI